MHTLMAEYICFLIFVVHAYDTVVTCGGLCPGLNDVIQGIVNKCHHYGVPDGNILGIQYGFKGFYDKKYRPVVLTKKSVEGIHLEGGTILGTSRGGADIKYVWWCRIVHLLLQEFEIITESYVFVI